MALPVSLDNARVAPRSWGEARLRLLHEQGLTLSDVARREKKDLSLVSRVNAGRKRHQGLERALASALGLGVRKAFPEWYGRPRRAA